MTLLESLFAILSPKTEAGDRAEDGRPQGVDMLNMPETAAPIKADGSLFSAPQTTETRRMKAWLADRIGRGRAGIFSEEVALTPVLAELMLEANANNRNIRQNKVAEFATDIINGDWELNGEPIIVADSGELNDGQHRCYAVIAAGKPMRTVITFGVRRSSRLTVDVGTARQAGDFLSMDGHKFGFLAAAVAALVWQYEKTGYAGKHSGGSRPTKVQIRHTYAGHPGLEESIVFVTHTAGGGAGGRKASVLVFCHYLLKQRNKAAADAFISRLILGDGLSRGDPIYHARERMLQDGRMRSEERIELVLRTWNATREGRRATKASPILGSFPHIEK